MATIPDTILLVDDQGDARAGMQALLESQGYRVQTAANGREALAALHGGLVPCIIVLDLEMPVMTGYAFRQAQMAYPAYAAIPVVLFSGADNLATTAQELGVTAYVAKPVDPEQVIAVVRRYCLK